MPAGRHCPVCRSDTPLLGRIRLIREMKRRPALHVSRWEIRPHATRQQAPRRMPSYARACSSEVRCQVLQHRRLRVLVRQSRCQWVTVDHSGPQFAALSSLSFGNPSQRGGPTFVSMVRPSESGANLAEPHRRNRSQRITRIRPNPFCWTGARGWACELDQRSCGG